MKTTFIYLGIAIIALTTKGNATQIKFQGLDKQKITIINDDSLKQNKSLVALNKSPKTTSDSEGSVIFYPDTVLNSNKVITIKDVIAENKLVIDNQEEEYQPLSIEFSVEDIINENNRIIESQLTTDEYYLDFEKINCSPNCFQMNNNAIKTTDLKL